MISRRTFDATLHYFLAPIYELLYEEESVREIMINGPREVYVEQGGELRSTEISFVDEEWLRAAVRNIAQASGVSIGPETARFDASLPFERPNGEFGYHRVHVVLPPLCRQGISVTIRKHSGEPLSIDRLIESGSFSQETKEFFRLAVTGHRNIIVSGGTGTGKTTLLNALSSLIPGSERIVVIEDTTELQLQQEHVLSLQTRAADRKGRGKVTIRDLLHSTLRMRPDRIVIGECRGDEALDLLQALNTGHGGSMSTLHANTPLEALQRLEMLALLGLGDAQYPVEFLRAQVAMAIHLVVQLSRLGGKRVVSSISANRPDGDLSRYRLVELFAFELGDDRLRPTSELAAYSKELSKLSNS